MLLKVFFLIHAKFISDIGSNYTFKQNLQDLSSHSSFILDCMAIEFYRALVNKLYLISYNVQFFIIYFMPILFNANLDLNTGTRLVVFS